MILMKGLSRDQQNRAPDLYSPLETIPVNAPELGFFVIARRCEPWLVGLAGWEPETLTLFGPGQGQTA